jgi:hypothetical protein
MSLDEAIQQMNDKIKSSSPGAEIKSVKMSEEEARLSVYAPAGDIQKIKDATFLPAIEGLSSVGNGSRPPNGAYVVILPLPHARPHSTPRAPSRDGVPAPLR